MIPNNFEDFKNEIMTKANLRPPDWRLGQAVYNYTYEMYPDCARKSQLKSGIDCFYDSRKIDDFLQECWKYYNTVN